jgi:hypothetical protein
MEGNAKFGDVEPTRVEATGQANIVIAPEDLGANEGTVHDAPR